MRSPENKNDPTEIIFLDNGKEVYRVPNQHPNLLGPRSYSLSLAGFTGRLPVDLSIG
jgi:hypothetical protein